MKTAPSLHAVSNGCTKTRQRVIEEGKLGLTGWIDATRWHLTGAARRILRANRSTHRRVKHLGDDLDAMLMDGVIDQGELARLREHRRSLKRTVRNCDTIHSIATL